MEDKKSSNQASQTGSIINCVKFELYKATHCIKEDGVFIKCMKDFKSKHEIVKAFIISST